MTHSVSRRRALLAFALGLACFCYAFVQRVMPSVIIDELVSDLAVGGAALGLLSGAYFYAYASMQIPVGMLIDRYGPRRLLSLAMLVCVIASAWMASSESLYGAVFARALIGAAVAFGFVGTLAIVARYFAPGRFALMGGVLQSAGMLGAVLGQAPLRLLVEQFGWRGTLWGLAAFAAVLAVLLWCFLPAGHQQIKPSVDEPRPSVRGDLRKVFAKRQNWYGAGLGFGLAAPMLAFSGLWAVPWLEQTYGFTTATAASLASLNFVGNAVGAPLLGWWSDHIARRKPVLIFGAFTGLICTLLTIYVEHWTKAELALLFFASGLAAAAIPTTFAALRELNPPAVAGTTLGLVNMFVVGSGAVLQPLIGTLLDSAAEPSVSSTIAYSASNYNTAFVTIVLANAVAFACALSIRESNCQNTTLTLDQTT